MQKAPGELTMASASIFGFDYVGFSTWVQQQINAFGMEAAEKVHHKLDTAFQHINAGVQAHGFKLIETLGDCALAVSHENSLVNADFIKAALDDVVAKAGVDLPFRSALVTGDMQQFPILAERTLWTGRGTEACHAAMKSGSISPPIKAQHNPISSARVSLLSSEVLQGSVGFLCLRTSATEYEAGRLIEIASFVDAAAAHAGSHLEKITHDDKGLLFRVFFASHKAALVWQSELEQGMLRFDVDFGIGLARGIVFRQRGRSKGEAPIVQGIAVNTAAKLAGKPNGAHLRQPEVTKFGADEQFHSLLDAGLRQEELQATLEGLRTPNAMVEVLGAAGMGKTHLLRAVAQSIDTQIVETSCRPRSMYEPFRPMRDLLQTFSDSKRSQYVSRDRELQGEAALLEWGDSICDETERISREKKALFIIDDLHWADEWSLRCLRKLKGSGVRFLLTSRHEQEGFTADKQVRLGPLADWGIQKLLGPFGNEKSTIRLCGGSPFFALQLAQALEESPEVARKAGSVDEIIYSRIDSLTDADRAVVRIAAVAARPLSLAEISLIGSRTGVAINQAQLGSLLDRRFLASTTTGYGVVHQLLTQFVCGSLPPSLILSMHHDVARTFLELRRHGREDITKEEVAWHWSRANSQGRAAALYGQAGITALQRGAYSAAIETLACAQEELAESCGSHSHRALWSASRAVAAWGDGQVLTASHEADHAIAMLRHTKAHKSSPAGRRRIHMAQLRKSVARAETGHFRGDIQAVLRGNLGAVRWGRRGGDSRLGVTARGLTYFATIFGVLRLRSMSLLIGKLALSIDRSPRAGAYVWSARAVVDLGLGHWARAGESLLQADACVLTDPEPQLQDVITTLSALCAQLVGDWEGALEHFAKLTSNGQNRGSDLFESWGEYGQAMALLGKGDYALAEVKLDRATELLVGLGDLQSELICDGLKAQVQMFQFQNDLAIATCKRAIKAMEQLAPSNFGSLEGFSGPALALAAMIARDNSDEARALYPAARRPMARFARVFPIARPRLRLAERLAEPRQNTLSDPRNDAAKIGMIGDAHSMGPAGAYGELL